MAGSIFRPFCCFRNRGASKPSPERKIQNQDSWRKLQAMGIPCGASSGGLDDSACDATAPVGPVAGQAWALMFQVTQKLLAAGVYDLFLIG